MEQRAAGSSGGASSAIGTSSNAAGSSLGGSASPTGTASLAGSLLPALKDALEGCAGTHELMKEMVAAVQVWHRSAWYSAWHPVLCYSPVPSLSWQGMCGIRMGSQAPCFRIPAGACRMQKRASMPACLASSPSCRPSMQRVVKMRLSSTRCNAILACSPSLPSARSPGQRCSNSLRQYRAYLPCVHHWQ